MTVKTITRAIGFAAGLLVLVASGAWARTDCSSLPTSALRTRPCNPQAECLSAIPEDLRGAQADARRKECRRLPTSGVCHGPDTYDPQAECRQQQRRK
jgi:hypothetical protein